MTNEFVAGGDGNNDGGLRSLLVSMSECLLGSGMDMPIGLAAKGERQERRERRRERERRFGITNLKFAQN